MDYAPDYYKKKVLVLGCGNILFGDDGFGPAVIDYLENHCRIPSSASALDIGTGVRELLFNIIVSDRRPELIVVVDALDCGRKPGEVFLASIEEIPENKINDFSLHLMPTLNMLRELRDLCNVEVVIVAAQPRNIPEGAEGGLSEEIKNAVKEAAEFISENYLTEKQ